MFFDRKSHIFAKNGNMEKKLYFLKKLTLIFTILFFGFNHDTVSQCNPTDHEGNDLIITSNTTLGGEHINIRKFLVQFGVTVTVNPTCKFLTVYADTIIVNGIINASEAGESGGNGGAGGVFANGSGNPGRGGKGGLAGSGLGGGNAGGNGGDGGFITQICGGFLCIGNRDGLNGGGGGGGGGGGASYGGSGGIGGWGAYGSGFSGAPGGNYGIAGAAGSVYGTPDGYDIHWGSGGGGAGGGGGGWIYGGSGGPGGKGGGMVKLVANRNMTITGSVLANGGAGGSGGYGAGESDDNTYDCSSAGYNSCSICPQAVFDAAGGAGGGAGGGSGGGILLQANGLMIITGTLQARGGDGGVTSYPTSTMGNCFDDARGGGGGGGGRIKIFSNPCLNHNINPSVNVSGGSGGQGLVLGISGSSGTYRNDLINPEYVPLSAGAIQLNNAEFCMYGDVPEIQSLQPASGGVPGMLYYQWEYSVTDSVSNFITIPGQTSETYNPPVITQTTWYRRKAVSGICSEYSNVVKATVIQPPQVSLTGLATQYCLTDPPVTMTGTPPGGTFSGPGVINNQFNPAAAGVGLHTITYTYTTGPCVVSDQKIVRVLDCTSIAEYHKEIFQLYPNPTNNLLVIECNQMMSSELKVEILTITGSKILEKTFDHCNLGQQLLINLNLPEGHYQILIYDDKVKYYNSFVISK